MTDIPSPDHENDHLCDVCGMISNPLQMLRDEDQLQSS